MALNVQMYSVRELSRDVQLAGDPYEEEAAQERLKELGVFFWRDEEHTQGVVLDVPQLPAKCFYQQLIVDDEEWTADVWDSPPDGYVERHGDDFSWIVNNQSATVSEVTKQAVTAER